MLILMFLVLFFFKKNTAYEMRISDWSSDVCSSDLLRHFLAVHHHVAVVHPQARHLLRAVGAAALRELVLVVRKDEVEAAAVDEVGRAACRERVCQYVSISVFAVSLKKNE